jgi:hypothetical protein
MNRSVQVLGTEQLSLDVTWSSSFCIGVIKGQDECENAKHL